MGSSVVYSLNRIGLGSDLIKLVIDTKYAVILNIVHPFKARKEDNIRVGT